MEKSTIITTRKAGITHVSDGAEMAAFVADEWPILDEPVERLCKLMIHSTQGDWVISWCGNPDLFVDHLAGLSGQALALAMSPDDGLSFDADATLAGLRSIVETAFDEGEISSIEHDEASRGINQQAEAIEWGNEWTFAHDLAKIPDSPGLFVPSCDHIKMRITPSIEKFSMTLWPAYMQHLKTTANEESQQ